MTIENADAFVLPSNPEDRKRIVELFEEVSKSLTRIEGERTYVKEAITIASENYNIPKKVLSKAAKVFHKQNFDELSAEEEQFADFYDTIVNNSTVRD